MTDARVFAGRYRVERELGVESSGRTYLAAAPDGERVVVKVVRPVDDGAAGVVEDELLRVSGLDHPGLPHIYEWGRDGRDLFVVREWLPGEDLKTQLARDGRLSPGVAAAYAADVADALERIHLRGVIHGNIKTANIIRTPEGATYLLGYSLGLQGDAARAMTNAHPSVAHYLAPEQVRGDAVTPATDIYALGTVLYELVAGRVPFDAASAAGVADQQANTAPRPLRDIAPDVPLALERIIMQAMEKSPGERHATAAAMRDELRAFAGIGTPSPAPALAPVRRSNPVPWIAAGLAALFVVALASAMAAGVFKSADVEVPDLTGRPLSDASASLIASGLELGSVGYRGAPVPGLPDGAVASQIPAPGTRAHAPSRVDVVLAGAERVQVPSLVGLTRDKALAVLRSAGFVADLLSGVATSAAAPGSIVDQSPEPGVLAPKGSVVTIEPAR